MATQRLKTLPRSQRIWGNKKSLALITVLWLAYYLFGRVVKRLRFKPFTVWRVTLPRTLALNQKNPRHGTSYFSLRTAEGWITCLNFRGLGGPKVSTISPGLITGHLKLILKV